MMNVNSCVIANSLVVVVTDIVIVKFVLGDIEAKFLLHINTENSESNQASNDNPQPAVALCGILDSCKADDGAAEEEATNDGCHVDKEAIGVAARQDTESDSEKCEDHIEHISVVSGQICDASDHPEDHTQQEAKSCANQSDVEGFNLEATETTGTTEKDAHKNVGGLRYTDEPAQAPLHGNCDRQESSAEKAIYSTQAELDKSAQNVGAS